MTNKYCLAGLNACEEPHLCCGQCAKLSSCKMDPCKEDCKTCKYTCTLEEAQQYKPTTDELMQRNLAFIATKKAATAKAKEEAVKIKQEKAQEKVQKASVKIDTKAQEKTKLGETIVYANLFE